MLLSFYYLFIIVFFLYFWYIYFLLIYYIFYYILYFNFFKFILYIILVYSQLIFYIIYMFLNLIFFVVFLISLNLFFCCWLLFFSFLLFSIFNYLFEMHCLIKCHWQTEWLTDNPITREAIASKNVYFPGSQPRLGTGAMDVKNNK